MAALTPDEILKISAPIEEIYARTVDELLINIARHFKSGAKDTAAWEIQKLGEMGALTRESALIIAKNTGQEYRAVYDAFMEAANRACLDIDPQLQRAVDRGFIPSGNATAILRESPAMQEVVSAYVEQATDKLNLTNTTMLESTRQEYLRAVTGVANEERLREAQRIIETQSLEAATAQETRPRAIRKAMDQLSERGITGFYDKAGRKWSAEAYSAMVVRTTAHNTAVQAVRTRQAEYGGGDVFQVSSHPGARPGCYPYQQKFYSWGGGSGVFVDGAGKEHPYESINSTTYGEPAGLFGVNCGHHPIPMIPGFSFPQDDPIQPEAENDKLYEQSQIQREYERDIRKAKRDLEMAKATGDQTAIKDAERNVKDSQARMRQFIKDTDGVRRYDRERIAGGGGRPAPKTPANTAPTKAPTAVPQPQTAPAQNPAAGQRKPAPTSLFVQDLQASGIDYVPVDRIGYVNGLEIIDKVGGGDQTGGSCSSAAFAYAGNRLGFDVRDFRGGASRDVFSRDSNIRKIIHLDGVVGWEAQDTDDFKTAKELLSHVEEGKEYYFACARHATMVRKVKDTYEYLELQTEHANGWHGLTDLKLKFRYGAQKSHTRYGQKYEVMGELIDIDTLAGNDDFEVILGYINTKEADQKKGVGGGAK